MNEEVNQRLKIEYMNEGTQHRKYILRELSLNIAQLSTVRQELRWLHFSLGGTLAFFDFCVPLWKALDEIYQIYMHPLLHLSDLNN